ncbi:hypothetical protein LTR10_003630 [Elasticomyces elasticus]|nr:hypothetical protein LTR10_003630 [Elasticomyces elasticus]KAK4978176.1 hypothetical protein LTR42_002554 [Elasticomyces elasticus]
MPEVTTRLAWAVPVDPVDLIAYLEAEVRFRPVADTLRLCNVFGKGKKADITRLPKEMVDLIEEFLIVDMVAVRTERQARCQSLCECFGGLCLPYKKHMTDEQKLDTVNEACRTRVAYDELTKRSPRRTYREWVRHRQGLHGAPLVPDHARCICEWQELVGKVGASYHHQGLVTKTRNFVLKNFGLEIFLAHGQTCENNGYGSIAYLTLPDAPGLSAAYKWSVRVDDCGKGAPYKRFDHSPPEDSWAHKVAIEAVLSLSEKNRFLKMLRSLGLPGWEMTDSSAFNEVVRAKAMPQLTVLARAIRDVTQLGQLY